MARALTVLLATVALLGTGCGGGSETVDFLVAGDPQELQAYRDVVAAFEETDPGIDVELVEAADRTELLTRLSTSLAGGVPPDLFLVNYRFFGQFAAKGAIEPIDVRLDASSAFSASDFYPQALDAFRWGGKLMCLPQNVSSLAVYWNHDLFRRYGVTEPKAAWGWADFLRAAEQLTRDGEGNLAAGGEPEQGGVRPEVYGLGVEANIVRLAPFVWSNGGELTDSETHPTRFTLDEPFALGALRVFLQLRALGVVPSEEEVEAEDDEARFAAGRLGMILASRRATPTFRSITDFEWDVAPLPVLRSRANVLHSDAFCITRASERKDPAWRFVEFALGPEGQAILARTGRTVPSLVEVAESESFLDPGQAPRSARVFLDAVNVLRPLPRISTWPEIEDATGGILENGFYHGVPAEDVARQLDDATRDLFARGETP